MYIRQHIELDMEWTMPLDLIQHEDGMTLETVNGGTRASIKCTLDAPDWKTTTKDGHRRSIICANSRRLKHPRLQELINPLDTEHNGLEGTLIVAPEGDLIPTNVDEYISVSVSNIACWALIWHTQRQDGFERLYSRDPGTGYLFQNLFYLLRYLQLYDELETHIVYWSPSA